MNTPQAQTPPAKTSLIKEWAIFRCIHHTWDTSGNTSVKRIQLKSGFKHEDEAFAFLIANADRLREDNHYEISPIYRKGEENAG